MFDVATIDGVISRRILRLLLSRHILLIVGFQWTMRLVCAWANLSKSNAKEWFRFENLVLFGVSRFSFSTFSNWKARKIEGSRWLLIPCNAVDATDSQLLLIRVLFQHNLSSRMFLRCFFRFCVWFCGFWFYFSALLSPAENIYLSSWCIQLICVHKSERMTNICFDSGASVLKTCEKEKNLEIEIFIPKSRRTKDARNAKN